MKILISTVTIILAAFVLFPAGEALFAQTGSSPQKSQPPKILRTSKQKQAKIKGKTNRRKSGYRYFVLTNSTTKIKYRGKMDLSKVPRVITLKQIN